MVIGADNSQAAPEVAQAGNWTLLLDTAVPHLYLANTMLSPKLKVGTHALRTLQIFGVETVNLSLCMEDDSLVTQLISNTSANQLAKLMQRQNLKPKT